MNLIQNIAIQSYKTVRSTKDKLLLGDNLSMLKNLMRRLVLSDLNINPKILDDQEAVYLFNDSSSAPVTYINVWKDENFTMGVFVLKPGSKIPLHDHPHMYGLIKVIYGSCTLKSFSIKETSDGTIGSSVDSSFQTPTQVCRHVAVNATTSSDVITLTPDVANFHEISASQIPIAFFDVLFPPYNDEEERSCNYYKELKNDSFTETELVKIDTPMEYWTDTEAYCGPSIEKERVYCEVL